MPEMTLNPLNPHDALKQNIVDFPTTKGFRTEISMKLVYQWVIIFFNF